jgi:glycerol kinase
VSVLAEQVDSTGGVYFVPAFSGIWFNGYSKLKDNLGLIHDTSELSVLAAQVDSTTAPAFLGDWFNP